MILNKINDQGDPINLVDPWALVSLDHRRSFLFLFIKGKDGEDDVPDDISFDDQVFDLSFHPNRDVIAAGEIDGRVTV